MHLYDKLTDPTISMEEKFSILEDRIKELISELDEFKEAQDKFLESL